MGRSEHTQHRPCCLVLPTTPTSPPKCAARPLLSPLVASESDGVEASAWQPDGSARVLGKERPTRRHVVWEVTSRTRVRGHLEAVCHSTK